MTDILIIGAGVAGFTAAIYALRSNRSVLIFDGNLYGGQIASTPIIENYPGIPHIDGAELAMKLYEQATALGAEMVFEAVTDVRLEGAVKSLTTDSGSYQGRAVIVANGAKRRRLGCKGEDRLEGKGVSWCATCDGALYKNKRVAVVGGGNTALEDALYLAQLAEEVHLIHRRDSFRGEPVLLQGVNNNGKIKLHLKSQIEVIEGEKAVSGITILQDGVKENIAVDGVFVCVGLEPDNGLFQGLPTDRNGYFAADESCRTPIPGVYVAGDTRAKPLRQIVTAAADGAVAAFEAGIYLNSM